MRLAVFALMAIAAAALVILSARYWRDSAADQIGADAHETLAIQAETLSGTLDKYRLLPPLISRQDGIAALFDGDSPTPETFNEARRRAEEVTGLSGAKDVAFLYPDGRLLASARGIFAGDPAGRAELVEAAQQGRLGRVAISLDTANRAYAFGSGVRTNGRLAGIIVVYVAFDEIEATWSLSANPIFVDDASGRVFLTNRPEWRRMLVSELREDTGSSPRFRHNGQAVPYADVSLDMPLLGWTLHVLADQRPVARAGLAGAVIAALACALAALGAIMLVRRRDAAILKSRRDRATALRLERIVRDRTRELSRSNISLSHEIEERKQAEDRLRKTQAELVQTAKLAALGQMSAALSHEFNQPLAAIRTYAENAERLLARDNTTAVSDNLGRIAGLVDRMAELSRTLLSFARKPGVSVRPVALGPVIDEAIMLAGPRARRAGVRIDVDAKLRERSVKAGRIRLAQVFVNLINNAVDALAGRGDGVVTMTCEDAEGHVTVVVADNGPGIAEDTRATIFDPFVTTKPVGEGIGIGLSIVYNIVRDFGGTIALRETSEPGAVFAVTLTAADSEQVAA